MAEDVTNPKKMEEKQKNPIYLKVIAFIAIGVLLLALAISLKSPLKNFSMSKNTSNSQNSSVKTLDLKQQNPDVNQLVDEVLPPNGVELPAVWSNYGKQLVDEGVIDQAKFESIYSQRGGLDQSEKYMLSGANNGKIKINSQNAGFLLNLLWAFGLGNKNEILDKGEMTYPQYGGAGGFASTGGWSLAKGNTMDHYSKHPFIQLSAGQQAEVDEVSKNIYRPCCGNSTHFPDCNHGMAMLGLLELMAKNNVSKQEMYKFALAVNSYWFPNNYLTIATYFKDIEKTDWKNVDPKLALSNQYSSSQGYGKILDKVNPQQAPGSGGGCGV